MHDGREFGAVAADLLPPGAFWQGFRAADGRARALLNAKGDTIAAQRDRGDDLIRETNPLTTVKMLADWEREYALPDACTFGDLTFQERRQRLLAKRAARGGQSIPYFRALAESLGYPVEFRRGRPFICGSRKSRCGDGRISYGRSFWFVTVQGKRVTRFRCGASRCGEPLVVVRRAFDLECELRRKGPAWAALAVLYKDE